MLNQVVLVGRLKEWKDENVFTMAIPRGCESDTDFIDITVVGNVKENIKEYCNKGDILGVKGTLESGNKIIGERISFLSSHSKDENEENC